MDLFEYTVQKQIQHVVDMTIRLGVLDFRLVSNVSDFPALKYFSATSQSVFANDKTDCELWCVSLSASTLDRELILSHIDRTYRGASFADGYYVTDHFGAPVYLVTRGRRYYVFGEELERVVWPYFVKHFLMLHALQNETLHLKAAACSVGSAGTLLLGRGGAGKTVFLSQLCINGAQFVSNSHSIVKDRSLYGVASSIRIRPGPWYENLTKNVKVSPGLKLGEVNLDPYDAFAINLDEAPIIKNVCILDFKQTGRHVIQPLSEQEAYDYAEQFSLAINVYRLEEDLLDFYDGNIRQFSQAYGLMKTQLRRLIQQSRCYYISSDMLNPMYRNEVLAMLGMT